MGYCAKHGSFQLTTAGQCPQCGSTQVWPIVFTMWPVPNVSVQYILTTDGFFKILDTPRIPGSCIPVDA